MIYSFTKYITFKKSLADYITKLLKAKHNLAKRLAKGEAEQIGKNIVLKDKIKTLQAKIKYLEDQRHKTLQILRGEE